MSLKNESLLFLADLEVRIIKLIQIHQPLNKSKLLKLLKNKTNDRNLCFILNKLGKHNIIHNYIDAKKPKANQKNLMIILNMNEVKRYEGSYLRKS